MFDIFYWIKHSKKKKKVFWGCHCKLNVNATGRQRRQTGKTKGKIMSIESLWWIDIMFQIYVKNHKQE